MSQDFLQTFKELKPIFNNTIEAGLNPIRIKIISKRAEQQPE